jgi:hypothetical protein
LQRKKSSKSTFLDLLRNRWFEQQASSKTEVRLTPHCQFGYLAVGGALSSAIEAFERCSRY